MLRPGVPADADGISGLLARALPGNQKSDAEVLRWQYWRNPFRDAICWVFDHDGVIVGHQARLPVRMRMGGEAAIGSMSVDGAIDEAYRRRGMYYELREAIDGDCCDRGVAVAFSLRRSTLPLPPDVEPRRARMSRFVRPIDAAWLAERLKIPRPVARRLIRPARGEGAEVRDEAPAGIDALWAELEPSIRFGTVKDAAWFGWRFDGHPHRPYRYFLARRGGALSAVAVVRMVERDGATFGEVMDVLAVSRTGLRAVVDAAASELDGAVALTFAASPWWPSRSMLRGAGLWRVPRRLERVSMSANARETCGDRPDLPRAPWAATLGDADNL